MVSGKRIDDRVRARVRAQLASGRISQWERGLKTLERLELRTDAAMVRSLRKALEGPDEWRRERTLYTLADVAVPGCYVPVLRMLDDGNSSIRDFACQALGMMHRRSAWPYLRRRLKDVDEQVRFSAIEALTWGAHALSLAELRAFLGDRSELVRLIVVEALVHYSHCPRDRSRVVAKVLAPHARKERSALVQCDLVEWSYSRTQSAVAIAKLTRLMAHRRGIVRRRACASIPEDLRPAYAARLLAADRYHLRLLPTPLEVHRALRYVLLNARRHAAAFGAAVKACVCLDPASSAQWFDGWRLTAVTADAHRSLRRPVARSRTWLLTIGWRRHGLLDPADVPGCPGRSSPGGGG